MTVYTFQFIALDSNGEQMPNAVGSFYGSSDTAFVTPIQVTAQDGTLTTTPTANRLGLVTFSYDGDDPRGYWKSGVQSIPVVANEAADTAAAAAVAAQAAAEAAAANTTAPTEATVRTVITTDLADPSADTTVAVANVAATAAALVAVDAIANAVEAGGTILAVTDNQYPNRTTRTKHAPAFGKWFPEAEGGVPGGSDTKAAFTNALAAAAGQGSVDLADGAVYGLNSLLSVPAGSTIHAANGATIQLTGAARTTGLSIAGKAYFENITFDLSQIPTSYGIQVLLAAAGTIFKNCRFTHSNGPSVTAVGIKVEGPAQITGCTFSNISTPIQVTGSTAGVRIQDNTITDWSMRAVYVIGTSSGAASSITISRNIIGPPNAIAGAAQIRQPIAFQGDDGTLFQNVRITGNTVVGTGTSHDPTSAQLTAGTQYGTADLISLHQADGFTISDNVCTDGGDVGITIALQCRNGVVSNNTCLRNDSAGISAGSSSSLYFRNVSITGNTCMDNGQNRAGDGPNWASNGINLQYAGGVIVAGNRCGDSFPSAAWVASKAYIVGDRVYLPNNSVLDATVSGTSGSTAPTAPAVGSTVTDGGVTWKREPSTQTAKTQQYGIAVQNSREVTIGTNDLTGNVLADIYQASNVGPITLPPASIAPVITSLASDVTVNNSTTLVASGITIPVAANAVYRMEAFILYNSGTTPDMGIKFNGPTSATLAWTPRGLGTATTGGSGIAALTSAVIGTTAAIGGAGANAVATPFGILTTSSTAGNLTLSFAQNTADASDTILRAGTSVLLTRIS